MLINEPLAREVTVFQADGRLFIQVPWERADRYREFLEASGIGSTLHLNPATRDARLELWTNLSADSVSAMIGGWKP